MPELITIPCAACRGRGHKDRGVPSRSGPCAICDGKGTVKTLAPVAPTPPVAVPVPMPESGSPLDTLRLALDSMHETCLSCDGTRYAYATSAAWCYSCNGTGRVLTPAGQLVVDQLLAVLAGHFAPADHGHSVQ